VGQGIDNLQVTGINSRDICHESDPHTYTDGNARDQLLKSRVPPLVYVVRFVQALILRKQLELFLTRDGV